MTVGRKPTPTNLKIIRGNPSRRPFRKNEAKPKRHMPLPPDHLDAVAGEEWNRISVQLYELGLLTEIDGPALAIYCDAHSTWVDAKAQIRKMGSILTTKKSKYPFPNPFIAIKKEASTTMTKLLTEFGMTPSSRSRIDVGKKPAAADDDPFAKFEGKNA